MYGTSRRWGPAEFKSNVQGIGLFNSIFVILLHFVGHHYTPGVLNNFFISLPVVLFGLVLGIFAARRINPFWFNRIVLVLLFIVGLSLIF